MGKTEITKLIFDAIKDSSHFFDDFGHFSGEKLWTVAQNIYVSYNEVDNPADFPEKTKDIIKGAGLCLDYNKIKDDEKRKDFEERIFGDIALKISEKIMNEDNKPEYYNDIVNFVDSVYNGDLSTAEQNIKTVINSKIKNIQLIKH